MCYGLFLTGTYFVTVNESFTNVNIGVRLHVDEVLPLPLNSSAHFVVFFLNVVF